MDPERWQRVSDIFLAALERRGRDRAAFLEGACGNDADLRAAVESLLDAHREDDDFLARPAFEVAGELLAPDPAESLVGERLGAYSILEKLGEGGMGVVYLAEDTRLGRRVAIKALPAHLTRDERSRERLRREARAAAHLSDPRIATVHALEELGEHLCIVYEYVEGRTLREELAAGPLPVDRLLATGTGIARALAAAHGRGIVHRDLKPENVVRGGDGTVKVLDFGLASFQDSAVAAGAPSPPISRLTLPGVILGTPSYMAPEQLRGEEVDSRADVFSFGVLLYELATGTHPFEGDSTASTIARILETEPAGLSSAVERRLPAPLMQVLKRCLAKDPAGRYADTADLVRDLESLETGGASRLEAEGAFGPAAEGASRFGTEGASGLEAEGAARLGAASGLEVEDPAATGAPAEARDASLQSSLWWWRFHQLFVGFGYYVMLVPLWLVKDWAAAESGSAWGGVVFFVALVPVGVAGILRIHLWFTSRTYPGELRRQRTRAMPWIRIADATFVGLLLAGAALVATTHTLAATVLVGVAVGLLITFTMIEPTTARAALGELADPE